MSKKQKLVGRVGVTTRTSGDFVKHSIALRVKHGTYGTLFLRFDALGDSKYPDRAFAFKCTSELELNDYDFHAQLELLAKLQKAMAKQTAPRAVAFPDGKAYLAHCELAQFLQACEKLDLHISRFDNWSGAFEFAYDLYKTEDGVEEYPTPEPWPVSLESVAS